MKHWLIYKRLIACVMSVALVFSLSGNTVFAEEVSQIAIEESAEAQAEFAESSKESEGSADLIEEKTEDDIVSDSENEQDQSNNEEVLDSSVETENQSSIGEQGALDSNQMLPGDTSALLRVADDTLNNPRIVLDAFSDFGEKVVWDCIWFGSYPQTEIVSQESDCGTFGKEWAKSTDYLVDVELYNQLEKAEWDSNGDAVIGSNKYRRLQVNDAKYSSINNSDAYYSWNYSWTDSFGCSTTPQYHYFKYEPIRWRVLNVSEESVLLFADELIDVLEYIRYPVADTKWEISYIRKWLNGYISEDVGDDSDNEPGNFFDMAFTDSEKQDIKRTEIEHYEGTVKDKVYLLSEEDLCCSDVARSYGFISWSNTGDNPGTSAESSTYAKARGIWVDTEDHLGKSDYWGRAYGGGDDGMVEEIIVSAGGGVSSGLGSYVPYYSYYGVRPAIAMDISSKNWSRAGYVCSDGTYASEDPLYEEEESLNPIEPENPTEVKGPQNVLLRNPTAVTATTMKAGRNITYDCIWFGSYPQREVVSKADECGTYGKGFYDNSDCIVDEELYKVLKETAGWSVRGDIIINGKKYRRLRVSNATYFGNDGWAYNWRSTTATYRYFLYEPIKWRVLSSDGSNAMLMADKGIDCQLYSKDQKKVTWENSSMRSWLNGYESNENAAHVDCTVKNFVGSAFTKAEQAIILNNTIVNEDSIAYKTEGGNNTNDKVFLLSESEIYNTALAGKYGFHNSCRTYDEARRCKSTTYAKAMGVGSDDEGLYIGCAYWFLRSPGVDSSTGAFVTSTGRVFGSGFLGDIADYYYAVRPVVWISLSSELWNYAGTTGSNGKVDENAEPANELPAEGSEKPSSEVNTKVSSVSITGVSNKIAAGKKVQLMADIAPANATNKAVTWTSSNPGVATVDANGLVTVKAKTGGKSVIITATAKDGSGKTATFRITSMKGAVKSIKLSGKKTVKPGKSLKLKATVKTTKGTVNKKLKWTSSNPNLATVSASGKVKTFKGKKGKVKITAMSTDGTNKKKSVTIKIK